MKAVILSLIIWIISVITIIIILPAYMVFWGITALFDKKLILAHYAVSFWASIYTILNPFWDISIEDRHKFKRNKTYIIISNHQSLLDILILFRLLRHFKWVSKTENFKIPVVGWIMSLNNYIKITRGDSRSVVRMMETCKKEIKSGISILMFPEGTRSVDGNLRIFKDGAFILAKETHTDILPIVLDGAAKAIPKNTLLLSKRQKITMKILDEIPASGFARCNVKEIKKKVYNNMNIELNMIRENDL